MMKYPYDNHVIYILTVQRYLGFSAISFRFRTNLRLYIIPPVNTREILVTGLRIAVSLRLKSSVAMAVPPYSLREGKLTNTASLSLAETGQAQRCDRLRMRWDGRIELVSD